MSESSEITGRLVTGEELDERELETCVALLGSAFERWPSQEIDVSPEEYLRWKLEIPGPAAARAHLLETDGRLVAFAVYLSRSYRVFGGSYRVMDGVDAAVHPDHQGEGLYRRRRELKSEFADPGYDFTVNFSLNERVMTYRRNRGRAAPEGRPRILRRFNDARQTAAAGGERSWWRRPLVLAAIAGLRWWNGVRYRPRRLERQPEMGWELREVERFDERVDGLFESAARDFDFVQERDQRWLNWRYADPRNRRYSIVLAEEGGELLGYTVYRRSRGHGFVMDLLALPGRSDVAASLLDVATRELGDCEVVECWSAPGHPYESVVRGQGYMGPAKDSGMLVRSIAVSEELFEPVRSASGRMHVMLGDTDWM